MRAAGVPEGAISIIPDEQEAVDAALNMGEAGDLLLVFADALVRSWKQITKFKPEGMHTPEAPKPRAVPVEVAPEAPALSDFEGLIIDERGVHLAREDAD